MSGVIFGFIAEHWGWNLVFVTMIVVSIAAALMLLTIFRAKASAYEEEQQ